MSPTGPVDLLISSALSVETMGGSIGSTGASLVGGWVAVTDGLVVGVGAATDAAPAAREVIDARGCLVTPGLVNAHQHLYQNLTRSMLANGVAGLTDWFWTYFSRWQHLDEEAVRTSTRLGLFELALSGATTSADHLYIHQEPGWIDAQVEEALDVGMRLTAVRGSMTLGPDDGGVCLASMVEDEEHVLNDCERLVRVHHDPSPTSMTQIAFGPSTLMSSTESVFRRSAELARNLGVRLHTHVADDPEEEAFVRQRYRMRPIEKMADLGWMAPDVWFAHVVYPSPREIASMAEHGVSVAHCPSAMVIDGGIPGGPAPVREMIDAGVNVSIGCDGATAADHQSLWLETKFAMLLARLRGGSVSAMTARDALWLATRGGAAALGREGQIGVLTPGACADISLWRLDDIAHAGAHADPVTALLQGGPTGVWSSFVGGQPLVRDGHLVGIDEQREVARHSNAARRLQQL